LQYRIFPELDSIFECRSKTKKNLINLFTRDQILAMNFEEFKEIYKSKFGQKSLLGSLTNKLKEFFLEVQKR
jgi:hypothetical protein